MAVDKFETEYHLTRSGWHKGTSYFFGKTQKEVAPPSDRLLTVVQLVEQSSRWAASETSLSEKWRSPDIGDSELQELRAKFPLPD
jgi:hypothetical protein